MFEWNGSINIISTDYEEQLHYYSIEFLKFKGIKSTVSIIVKCIPFSTFSCKYAGDLCLFLPVSILNFSEALNCLSSKSRMNYSDQNRLSFCFRAIILTKTLTFIPL